jgi:hypothetical protein
MGSKFKLALIQLAVGTNKTENLARAALKIAEAVNNGAQVVSLPGRVHIPVKSFWGNFLSGEWRAEVWLLGLNIILVVLTQCGKASQERGVGRRVC